MVRLCKSETQHIDFTFYFIGQISIHRLTKSTPQVQELIVNIIKGTQIFALLTQMTFGAQIIIDIYE